MENSLCQMRSPSKDHDRRSSFYESDRTGAFVRGSNTFRNVNSSQKGVTRDSREQLMPSLGDQTLREINPFIIVHTSGS